MQQKVFWLLLFASIIYFSPERDEIFVGALILLTVLTLHETVGVNVLRWLDASRKETGIALAKEKKLKEKALSDVSNQSSKQLKEIVTQFIYLENEMTQIGQNLDAEFGKKNKLQFIRGVNEKLTRLLNQFEDLTSQFNLQTKRRFLEGIGKKIS